MEFNFENNFDFDFGDFEFEDKKDVSFVQKHASSEKVFDFTKQEERQGDRGKSYMIIHILSRFIICKITKNASYLLDLFL